jgi:uncharacterized phage protein gp47/JayE
VRKPLEAILDDVAARQRADIDPNWNTEADSLAGQYNGILGDELAQLWEALEATYYVLSRDADDAALDIVGALTGTAREGATKSRVTLTLDLNANVTVPAGSIVSVEGDPSIRVVTLAAAATDASPDEVDVIAEAETAGAITANPYTLTVIETSVPGWTAVTNAAKLDGGTEIESDEVYRLRQLDEIAAGGGGSVPGMQADVLAVPDVTAVRVIENDSNVTVGDMPPKSVEVIVRGGENLPIAQAIFESKSGGIATYGTEWPEVVTDSEGFEHEIRFSRPELVVVYVAIGLTVVGDYPGISETVKQAIEDATNAQTDPAFLGIGTDVYAARIVVTALGVDGVLNARVGLSLSAITDPAAGAQSISIGERQLALVFKANIVASVL